MIGQLADLTTLDTPADVETGELRSAWLLVGHVAEFTDRAAPPTFKVPESDSIDGFAPNVTGCALQCVTKAVLTPNARTPHLGLDIEVSVPARIDITLT